MAVCVRELYRMPEDRLGLPRRVGRNELPPRAASFVRLTAVTLLRLVSLHAFAAVLCRKNSPAWTPDPRWPQAGFVTPGLPD